MPSRTAYKIGWIVWCGSLAVGLSGCASRPILSGLVPSSGAPSGRAISEVSDPPVEPAARISLPTIPYDQRQPTWLAGATTPLLGRFLAEPDPTQVRSLSLAQCESMARDAAPLATQLRQHAQWLEGHGQTSLSAALHEQARFESDKHRLMAVEAYLNLAKVYAQTTVIDQSLTFLNDLRESVGEFRRAGVQVAVTNNELERQELSIQESIVELQYNQNRLIGGLEAVLQISTQSIPIWSYVEQPSPMSLVDETTAFEFARQHRGDLKALQILAANADSIPSETVQQLHPFLSAGVPIPTVSWWMCLAKREAECLEQSQRQQRKRLLDAMVAAKIEQIRTEVKAHCLAMQRIDSLLELKIQQRELLREERQNRNRAEQGPVDIAAYVTDSQQELKWTSDIIALMFDQQIEQARLEQVLGQGLSVQ